MPLYAGGWPQKKGEGFYKFDMQFFQADRYYLPNGDKQKINTLSNYSVNFYGEYGLTNQITAIVYWPFYKRLVINRQVGRISGIVYFDGAKNTNVGDMDLSLRAGLFQLSNTALSGAITLGMPLGDNTHQHGLYTGDGEFNQMIAIEGGYSFYPLPMYASASFGFNNRTKKFSDEWRGSAEIGYTIKSKMTVIGRLRGVESLRNGDVINSAGDIFASDVEYLIYSGEVLYALRSNLGVSLNFDSAFYGKNILATPTFTFGIFIKQ